MNRSWMDKRQVTNGRENIIYTISSPLIGITNMDYVRFCLAWYETIKVLPSYIEFQWDLIYFVASTSEARKTP